MEKLTVNLNLEKLYYSDHTVFGKKVKRDYYAGRTSRNTTETYLAYDGLILDHDKEDDSYNLIDDKTGIYLAADGEECEVVAIHGNQYTLCSYAVNLRHEVKSFSFVLNEEEFKIATGGK